MPRHFRFWKELLGGIAFIFILSGCGGADIFAGRPGARGPAGAPGVDGADGLDGEDGTNGTDGEKGDQGSTGPRGPQGNSGSQGPVGPRGDEGPEGSQGPEGSPSEVLVCVWDDATGYCTGSYPLGRALEVWESHEKNTFGKCECEGLECEGEDDPFPIPPCPWEPFCAKK